MKTLECFHYFSDEEWKLLLSKHSEQDIKWLISKTVDKAIARECERINDENFSITTDDESEEEIA